MKKLLQILFLFLTWFTNLANTTPVFTKVVLPNYELSYPKTEDVEDEFIVKIGVQNFARSGISKNSFSQKENAGKAVPLTLLNDYNQYVNKYDIECAFFLGMEYMAMYAETVFEPIVVANAIGKIQKLAKTYKSFKGPKGSIDDLLKKNSAGVQGAGSNIFSTLKTEINILSKQVKSHTVLEAEYLAKYPGSTNYPYLTTALVEDIVLSTNTKFVRFHDANNINREWMMSIDDFNSHIANGGNLDDIVEKLALPTKPTKISLVEIPANETIRKSIAGPQQWSGIPYQTGGSSQYEILGFSQSNPIPVSWYSQTTDLNLIFP